MKEDVGSCRVELHENALTPEWRLVLRLARSCVDNVSVEDMRAIAGPSLDWQQVFEISHAHRIFPIVYKNIKDHCPDLVPVELLEQQKKQMMKLCVRNMSMTVFLIKLLELLAKNNIPAVPFKGPVLAHILYGDIIYRSYSDLDLLIHPEDLPQTVRLLEENGFTASFELSDDQLKKLVRTEKEYPLSHDKTGLSLDLQWELTDGYFFSTLNLQHLLPECRLSSIDGRQIKVFGREDLLMYLCIHGTMHVWAQLDHVCCVAELINQEADLDWDTVIRKSRALGCERMLKIGVLLALRLFDARVPPVVMRITEDDPRAVRLANGIISKFYAEEQENIGGIFSRRFFPLHLASMDSKIAALRYCLYLVFSPTRYDWLIFPIPSSLWIFLYLLRPFRLIFVFAQRFFAHMLKSHPANHKNLFL